MSEQQPRPGQATMAAILITGGSIFVVLAAWERIAGLRSIESQEQLRRALDEPGFSGTGLGIEGLTSLVQVLAIVGAAAATAAAILGVRVLGRDALARIALTVLAPVVLIGGMTTSAKSISALVVVGVTLLWTQPTRDWYAGRPWLQLFEQRRDARLAQLRNAGAQRAARAQRPQQLQGGSGQPPAGPTYGPPAPGAPMAGTGPWVGRHAAPMPPVGVRPPRGPRPTALVVACALTWLGCAGTALVSIHGAVTLPSERDRIIDEIERQQGMTLQEANLTPTVIEAVMYGVLAVMLLWAIVAAALAVLAFLGHNWARITLIVSAVTAGMLGLLASLGGPTMLVLVVLIGVSLWLLLRPAVGAWLRS